MYYCYRHIRLDKNQPFYIGVGSKPKKYSSYKSEYKRAFSTYSRNKYWNNIAKFGFIVEIVFESDDRSVILKKEQELISLYGLKNNNGILCNMTNGGEQNKFTEKMRKEQSIRMLGNTLMNGRVLDENWRANISKSLKGREVSENSRKALSKRNMGNTYAKGVKRSEATKAKISNARKGVSYGGKKVFCVNDNKTYASIKECSIYYFSGTKNNQNFISKVCNGYLDSYNGKVFKFV